MWIKGRSQFAKYPVVFNGTDNTTKLLERIEILGNLREKDCTTVFYNVNRNHTDSYYFRIEMAPFFGTFKNKALNLDVHGKSCFNSSWYFKIILLYCYITLYCIMGQCFTFCNQVH